VIYFEDLIWLFNSNPSSRGIIRMNIAEGALLYKYCKRLSNSESILVEIGRKFGGSTVLMSSCLHPKSKLYSVDIQYQNSVAENLNRINKIDQVILINKSSVKAGKNWDKPINLILIDGAHSKIHVKQDIKIWLKHVKANGYALFHDAVNHKPELWKLMKELMRKNWIEVDRADSLLCLQKQPD